MPGPFPIPMMRATGLGPLPQFLEDRASWSALSQTFAAEKIPLAVIENKDVLIPFESTVGLFDRAARTVGDRLFGLHVGEGMQPSEFGLWLEYASCARSLGDALQRADRTSHHQQPGGRTSVEVEGTFAIWRFYPPVKQGTSIQYSDHVIFPMIRFIGSYIGAHWRPSWIELNYRREESTNALAEMLGAPLQFERPCVGIAFERNQLKSRKPDVALVRDVTLADVTAGYATSSLRVQPVQSVLSIVTLRLLDGYADIEGAAEMAGLGIQTLQRMLRRNGLSYREVVDIARSTRAQALLRETDKAVTDIALDLGYTDHANFTRAFNRWLGCSPSDFRGQAANGQAGQIILTGG